MLIRGAAVSTTLVPVRDALDWLRLSYSIYKASDFWTEAELNNPMIAKPSPAPAVNTPKPGVPMIGTRAATTADIGTLHSYDPKVNELIPLALDMIERHSEISLAANQSWTWNKSVKRGQLYTFKRFNIVELPIKPVASITSIKVFGYDHENNRYDQITLPQPNTPQFNDDYVVNDGKLYISKHWTYESPGIHDEYEIVFVTGAGNANSLNFCKMAALRVIAYLYEHAGDEMGMGNVIQNSGAYGVLANIQGSSRGLLAL